MTIGQRRRHKSASIKKSFTMADKQKARMHEAAQLQLFQMSDVQGELHKKQPPAASRKRRAAEREAHHQPQLRCKPRNISLEEKASAKHKENIDKQRKEEGQKASGGFDYLLILANSAELMESEGKCYMEKTPDTTLNYGDGEAEKSALRVRGRIRLTQIRHRARLENSQQIHDTHVGNTHEHANLQLCVDTKGCKSVDTNLVRAMEYQNDQDPRVLAKNGNTGTADISLPTFESESVKVNNEKLQQSAECRVTISQPVSMTAEHGKFTEKQSDAHKQRIAKTNDPLKAHFLNEKQEHRHASRSFHTEQSASLVKKSEAAKVRLSIARERRKQRVFERRKQRHSSQFQWLYNIQMRQMFEAQRWWLWHVINATGELCDVAKQQRSLYMSYVEREQRRVSARQRRAQKIQEKRESKKMHRPLNNPRPVECHSEEVSHNSNVGTGVERNAIPVEEHRPLNNPRPVECHSEEVSHNSNVGTGVERNVIPVEELKKIQEKRESKKMHRPLNNPRPVECHSEEVSQNSNVGSGVERNAIPVEEHRPLNNPLPVECHSEEVSHNSNVGTGVERKAIPVEEHKKFQEKRESKKMHRPLNNPRPVECHSEEVSHNSNVGTGVERNAIPVEEHKKIQEERESKKVHRPLNNPRPVECHSEEVSHDSNVGTGVERNAIPVEEHRPLNNPRPVECHSEEVSHISNVGTGVERNAIPVEEHPTIAIVCEDQCGKLLQKTTNVDHEEKASSVGQIRLTQLKREVRLKHSAVKMEKLTQQMDKGDESTSS